MKRTILHLTWLVSLALAQDTTESVRTLSGSDRRLTSSDGGPTVPSDFDDSTIASISTLPPNGTISASTISSPDTTTTSEALTSILGSTRTSTANDTASATMTTAPRPSNTQPCNNYREFCTRKYSNITEVCAHNSPFVRKNNAASNQQFGVTQQLNDGIRVLQGQAHLVNGTLYYCHTSCDLLSVGTVEDYLREVVAWLDAHPFEVITIIFGNYGWQEKDSAGNALVTATNFVDPVKNSGLLPYIYQPPKIAMEIGDWPTLGELILSQKRVITFIDYNFNANAVPWLLWEFYNVWETPFSPTDFNFPCTIGRPDGLGEEKAREIMYMANHNLNAEIAIGGLSLLVPNTVFLNRTNGVEGTGSLGNMTVQCTEQWDRPPNFLLVDYYNIGLPTNGSVFEVAARANGVTYNRKCCGTESVATTVKNARMAYLAPVIAVLVSVVV
ncbi:PLC-like phosphodiesterase [Lentithecium fluviatile CBS 122367]|uniref:PLC-like phosphodiesterase n=1 Tax=Lentithecium fluviatile CBS 122367 TaxID=1168545 RepID=A0A6G1JP56_9PLEO|nr:PLC-like phosphodiesterase [Lentithecium fluviatile CBS 122367]